MILDDHVLGGKKKSRHPVFKINELNTNARPKTFVYTLQVLDIHLLTFRPIGV